MTRSMWEIYEEKQENHYSVNHPRTGDNVDYSCYNCYPVKENKETAETQRAIAWIRGQAPINKYTGAMINLLK
jgi:hypothetical protein